MVLHDIESSSSSDCQPASIPGEGSLASSSNICESSQPRSFYYSPPSPDFFRPRIRIGPKADLSNHIFGANNDWKQQYITIRVKNTGRTTLHNCGAELSVIPLNEHDPTRYPLDIPHSLAWGRFPRPMTDLTNTRPIQANGSQILHVVFSDSDFANTQVSDGSKRYACISTFECLNGNRISRHPNKASYLPSEDSFSEGEFIIRISIFSDEGSSKSKLFLLHVDQDYEKINMKPLPFKYEFRRRLGLLRKISW
jgi:hypothetical protein